MQLNRAVFKRLLCSKVVLVVGLIALAFIVFQLSKVFYKRIETHNEMEKYKQEVARLEQQQNRLQKVLDYLNTDQFAEGEARTKLGMKKQGEQVVVIQGQDMGAPPVSAPATATSASASMPEQTDKPPTNRALWWDYFFKY